MDFIAKNINQQRSYWTSPIVWGVFFLYILISGYAMIHHEMWGDEIHSWNIVKGSESFFDLIHNIRYEGHPLVWYSIMWPVSKFTHNLAFIQAIHWLIANSIVFFILFLSPFALSTRLLIPFGYYFLFEYGILSRNYAIGILTAICICLILRKQFRYKTIIYYTFLFLLSNTHLLGILLAGAIHVYYLLQYKEEGGKKSLIYIHALIGLIIVIPAVIFIFPPSDSEMNVQFWLSRWGMRNFRGFSQAPVRSFIPIPPWWIFPFWNYQFMLELTNNHKFFWIINLVTAVSVVTLVVFILKKNTKSLGLFSANLLFSFMVAMTFFTLGSARYAGFLYIGFIIAYWLYCEDTPVTRLNKYMVNGLLLLQLCGSIQPLIEDVRHPFSNAYRVKELLSKAPAGKRVVTDYWTLNAISAFADTSFYCIDLQKEISFIIWNGQLKSMQNRKNRFTDGVKNLFEKEGITDVIIVSINPPDILSKADPQLEKEYKVTLLDKREGAIERSSNLYLYDVKAY